MNALRVLDTEGVPSERLLRACGLFGLGVRKGRATVRLSPSAREAARKITATLPEGGVVLISGVSGSGKSQLLRAVERRLRLKGRSVQWVTSPAPLAGAVIDLVEGPVAASLGMLSRVGMGDATLISRSPRALSEGERFRLALAIALARLEPGGWLLCDEFTSVLDRGLASRVAAGLSRWAAAAKVRVALASPHDDVRGFLPGAWEALCRPGEEGTSGVVTLSRAGRPRRGGAT